MRRRAIAGKRRSLGIEAEHEVAEVRRADHLLPRRARSHAVCSAENESVNMSSPAKKRAVCTARSSGRYTTCCSRTCAASQ